MTNRPYPKNIFSRRMRDLSFEVQQKAKSPYLTDPRLLGTPRPASAKTLTTSFDIFREDEVQMSTEEQGTKAKGAKWAHRVQQMPSKDVVSDLNAQNMAQPVCKLQPSRAPMSARSSRSDRSKCSTQLSTQTSSKFFPENELRSSAESLTNPKLGKPTRTTILRARQRCHSAPMSPINGCDDRREYHKKFYQDTDFHKSLMTSVSNDLRDLVTNSIPDGESAHSYLTGARYNRSDCLDAKSWNEKGVYMPRRNPQSLFVVKGYVPKKSKPETSQTPTPSGGNDGVSDQNGVTENSEKMTTTKTTELPSDQSQEVRECVCESSVPAHLALHAHHARATNQSTDVPGFKGRKTERRRKSSSAEPHKRSPRGPARPSTPRRHSAPDPPLGSLYVQGKALVLGRSIPKTTKTSLNSSGLHPPTSTPRCQSVTALDVGRKLFAENANCRCNCIFNTLVDTTIAVLATEDNGGAASFEFQQCDRCNKDEDHQNTDTFQGDSQDYLPYNQAYSHADETTYSDVTESSANQENAFTIPHSSEMESQEISDSRFKEKFQTPFSSIPRVANYRKGSAETRDKTIRNTAESKPKKVPLFVIDIKVKKAGKNLR